MTRRLIGNLDCEVGFAAVELGRRGGRASPGLPTGVMNVVSGAATLLRVFADHQDVLWTPLPVAPSRLPGVEGLPHPVLVSGPLLAYHVPPAVLAWGETPEIASLRPPPGTQAEAAPHTPATSSGATRGRNVHSRIHELLWRLPAAPAAATARVNNRRFCLETAEDLGCRLPGAGMLTSIGELERKLFEVARPADTPVAWVVKAQWSAAGRSRVRGRGTELSDPHHRRALERLFERHRKVLFEPWMARTADYGAVGLALPGGPRLLGFHRQQVDGYGRFQGLVLGAHDDAAGRLGIQDSSTGLTRAERERYEQVVLAVGAKLLAAGYLGPYSVDAWRYRRPDGSEDFHPLGEINARMSFGLVARALLQRAAPLRDLPPHTAIHLRLSRTGPPPGAIPLLLPAPGAPHAAWIEVGDARRKLGLS